MKTSATITVNGTPREITFTEGLTQELFYTSNEETQNFILRLASAQAFIAFGKRFAESQMKAKQIDYAAVEFPSTMAEFIAWGMSATRGASPTKSALDAAQNALDKLLSEMSELVAAADFANPRLGEIGAQLPAAKSAVAAAKAAHDAAEAAKPKKPKASATKPVEAMTAEEATAELERLEAEAAEVDKP